MIPVPRRLHQCHKTGCDSEAVWNVAMTINCPVTIEYGHRIKFDCTINCCGRHCNDAMTFVLSPPNRTAISNWLVMQGWPRPDFATAEFGFDCLDHTDIDTAWLSRATVTEGQLYGI